MALSSSEIKAKSSADFSEMTLLPQLSLRSVKAIVVGLLACLILAFLVLWRPAYIKVQSLQKEKDALQVQVDSGFINESLNSNLSKIPTMDQLPAMIESCRSTFVKEGVNVIAFNVERFGEKQETGKEANVDYALVRMGLQGEWSGIFKSLKAIEDVPEISIHVQEVVLASPGGEVLLQIYFRSGE